jgi:hypothetical protein
MLSPIKKNGKDDWLERGTPTIAQPPSSSSASSSIAAPPASLVLGVPLLAVAMAVAA